MKTRRQGMRSFPRIDRPLRLPLSACLLACGLALSTAGAHERPIWTFDFRDVFYDVAFLNQDRAVIVGAYGRVLVSHEKYSNLWSPRDAGTRDLLTSVSFVDAARGWAAGHGGVILHTRDGGQSWETQRESSPEHPPLLDIQFPSPEVGYACGAYGTFLKTTDGGRHWTSRAPPASDTIYNGLAFLDEAVGYLVGEFGTVLRTRDGARSWEPLDLGDHEGTLFGATLLSAVQILVYGISGRVFRSDDGGDVWVDVSPGVAQSLFRGAALGDHVVLVGASGCLVASTDGGRTFRKRIDEDFTTFAGVGAHPAKGFVCVGERGKIQRIPASVPTHEEDGR